MYYIFALNILIARPEKPKNERMLPKRPISNSVRAASFIPRSGDFSDLSNELKRPARIAALFIFHNYSSNSIFTSLTAYEMLYPLKPKSPV